MADTGSNIARAVFGQGLGMGWGDEAEAWLRSKLQGEDYEKVLAKIRREYGEFSKENPFTSGALEFTGGVVPGLAAMLVPGGQAVGATQLARTGTGTLARLAGSPMARAVGAGTASGTVAGAGTAEEGQRISGAGSGAALGASAGVVIPGGMRATKSGASWLREKLAPSEKVLERKAAEKMTVALRESNLTPKDIQTKMAADKAMNVPSVVANVDPALADLAETVAQRTGKGTRTIEKRLAEQKAGSRERTYQQVVAGVKPGSYYDDLNRMTQELRDKADDVYEQAYAHGTVDDPRINEVLKSPAFAEFYDRAKSISNAKALAAKLEGKDPAKYQLRDIYTFETTAEGKLVPVLKEAPDVRTLDYIKQGIDATIDSYFSGGRAKDALALKDLRRVFVNALDETVPDYKTARKVYAGDIEVIEAMKAGYEKFNKLNHEEIIGLVSKMSQSEKDAFRTGVSRELYGRIMNPSGNFNAAQKIIGAPEMQAKLQTLFDDPAQFRLFQAALEREAQLFHQANKVLGGSQTGKRAQMAREFEAEPGAGEVLAQAVTGGFWSSLSGLTARVIRSGNMSTDVADKLATMLMSKDPNEVAAVVKVLENYAAQAAPRAARATAAELGTTTGVATSIYSPPAAEPRAEELDIDAPTVIKGLPSGGPDIEADIEAELKKVR